jgi:hypothetical protein
LFLKDNADLNELGLGIDDKKQAKMLVAEDVDNVEYRLKRKRALSMVILKS